MANTPKLNLAKPAGADFALVSVLNGNMDILDEAVLLTASQTLTNKTLSSPTFSSGAVVGAAIAAGAVTSDKANLTNSTNQLSADVTCTNANTFYDGPSLSLAAGTWLLIGHVQVRNSGGSFMTAKLWDGTTAVDSGEAFFDIASASASKQISLTGVVAPTGTTTYKISVASVTGSSTGLIQADCPDNGAGHTASTLVALRIA